jgi:hypothetical protein
VLLAAGLDGYGYWWSRNNTVAWRINEHLARWAMHKFKRFRESTPKRWPGLQKVYQHQPRLFAHWQLIAFTLAGLWGPDGGRPSRPVLRTEGSETPPADLPGCGSMSRRQL